MKAVRIAFIIMGGGLMVNACAALLCGCVSVADVAVEQPVYEATCDKKTDNWTFFEDGTSVWVQDWFAEFPEVPVSPRVATMTHAVACDLICFGVSCGSMCPKNASCIREGYVLNQTCVTKQHFMEDDKLTVYCGSRTEVERVFGDQDDVIIGNRYSNVYVRVGL